jgi:hypothetical protein
MKKIITSAGIVALGAVGLQAAYAPGLTAVERSKPWSVSAALRGFYDDNYATLPSTRTDGGPTKAGSWGFDFSPSLSLNFPFEQTLASLSYTYDLRYYADRDNSADHSHKVVAKLDHAFTEDYKLDLSDTFVIAQEAELLNPDNAAKPTLMRLNGNNIRNTAAINFHGQFTRQLGFLLGYGNSLYDYDDPNYRALLNRMEHMVTFNLRWQALPQTVAILGYQYGIVEQDQDENVRIPFGGVLGTLPAKVRDRQSHYVYIGADQTFNPQLNGMFRVGAEFTDYPNVGNYPSASTYFRESNVTPYADANITWTYLPGSYAQLGIKHSIAQTDIYAQDQEATAIYGSINHSFTPKFMASLIGQYQNSSLEKYLGGASVKEDYYVVGLNLAYKINEFLSAEAGYNFDQVDSDVANRGFTRNRVYLGFRAAY